MKNNQIETLKSLTNEKIFISNFLTNTNKGGHVAYIIDFTSRDFGKLLLEIGKLVEKDLGINEFYISSEDKLLPKRGHLKVTNKTDNTILHIMNFDDNYMRL